MKTKVMIGVALAATLCLTLFSAACGHMGPVRTRVTIGVGFFYDHLAAYGDWLWIDAYGWVWTPWGVGPDWRPYTHGRWVYTIDGWTWVSSWRWGWAPFHYGRWMHHDVHGWVWIPGTHWAPAWVAWRHGEGTVGWAPLPPQARWEDGNRLRWDGDGIDVWSWSFIRERDFLRPDVGESLYSRDRNPEELRATRDRTAYEHGAGGIVSHGIPPSEVERVTGPVERLQPRDVERPPRSATERINGGRIDLYRPHVTPAPDGRQPPPASKPRPTHRGRGDRDHGHSGHGHSGHGHSGRR